MGMSTLLRWIAVGTLLSFASPVAADDASTIANPEAADPEIADPEAANPETADLEAGKVRSFLCIGCHGLNGEGKEAAYGQPAFPRIAGQIQGYLIKSVNDYKSGSRDDPMMGAIAKGLSDDDIANLAAFYSIKK